MSDLKLSTYRPITDLIPTTWQSGQVALDDGHINYLRTGGDKPPVILFHGFQVDGRMWLRTALELQSDFDCIMPDVRGHGLSSPIPANLDADTLSDDMKILVDSLAFSQPPVIIGHSMGAEVTARLAGKIDAKQVVLVDPALKNFMAMMPPIGDELPDYMKPIVETIKSLGQLPHDDRMTAGQTLLPPGTTPYGELDFVTFVEGQSRFDVASYKHARNMGYIVESPEIIAGLTCPILLMTAKQMMMRPDEFETAVKIFTDNWRQGEHVHFPDSGHAIMFDQFERFIVTLRTVL